MPASRRPVVHSTSPRVAAAIAVGAVAVWLACSLVPAGGAFSLPDRGDIGRYFGYAERTFDGQIPYRDFVVEYPPGFLPVILAAGPADGGYFDRFRSIVLALGTASLVLLVTVLFRAGAGAAELAAAALVPATLPLTLPSELVFNRFDMWPAALVLLSLAGLLHGRRGIGLGALGVAAAAKVYPLALAPLALLADRDRRRARRGLVIVAAVSVAAAIPFALVAPRGIARVGWLLVRRDLHVESLGASLLLAAHRLDLYEPRIYLSYGVGNSWDLAGSAAQAVAAASSLAQAAALVGVWYAFARGPRAPRDLLLAAAATVVGVVAFGKVLSPQFLVWVAAGVPLALGSIRSFTLPAAVAAVLLTRHIYVDAYDDVLRAGQSSWILLGRNAILVAIFFALVLELRARTRVQVPAPSGGDTSVHATRARTASFEPDADAGTAPRS